MQAKGGRDWTERKDYHDNNKDCNKQKDTEIVVVICRPSIN